MSTPPFLDLPAGMRAYHLETGRGELAVLDSAPDGRQASRSPALLIPGFTGSKEDFIAVLPGLAGAGHRTVAIDQRGQHESPGPDDDAAYAVAELARDVLAVAEAMGGGPVHLVGHSFGGLVARDAVLAEPSAARSLTLLCSGPAAIPGAPAVRMKLMIDALGHYDMPTLWEAMQAQYAARGGKPPPGPEVADFLRRRFLGNSPTGLREMARRLLDEPDRVAELATLTLPTLVAYGVGDDAWPPAVQAEMAERLGARRVAILDAAHSPAVEQPELTAKTLAAFWADAEGATR